MYIGFDYGTANCSVASIVDGEPKLLPLEHDNQYIPSTLAAPTRESVSELLFRHYKIKPTDVVGEQVLRRAVALNRDEGLDDLSIADMSFGQTALDQYLADPRDTYYVKSPKSFLGASGLHDVQISFFEDLVCAMMVNIKHQAEQSTQQYITQAVIGRPVNFHGRGGEVANQQAEKILTQAAKRAGYKNIEFQFEPVAAGLEYESTLQEDKTILVVDIGGGTTDCSLIDMGPTWRNKSDRSQSLLAHSGQRVGGNDLDIYLAFKQLMIPFGMGSQSIAGLDMPLTQFWNPIAINDIEAQKSFYSQQNLAALKLLRKEAQSPEKLDRLLSVYQETLGYSIVRKAEEAKIALAKDDQYRVAMNLLSDVIEVDIDMQQMVEAIATPKNKMVNLVQEAILQSDKKADAIFMTGGSARSPILRQAVQSQLPNTPIVSGNYFGSVTAGLARWADICFKG
ncbi:molecular chaperone [Vibrio sp. 10N.286.49.B3]|uniref:molecular chaperone n=1 Tax=Vibrio sp. 10N.286.49.B3 TaxID=1880855 RepID=UPI000C83811B|nr:molecular chaperone [Vibrio sp. 10N.286.49.B3]PMH43208.1 molecular chaperone [Vibrio sp. 10N.286.49.B3]